MHVSKEFLLEAVGLSMVVALIMISMQIFQKAEKITSMLEVGQESYIEELETYEIVKYDGLAMDGITTVNYIKRMVISYELPVTVVLKECEYIVSTATDCNDLRDVNSEYYINPMEKYQCEISRDENDVIKEIKLVIVKEGD